MPSYHWLRLRAVVHPTEDEARVRQAMRFVSGLEPAEFDAALERTELSTHHGLALVVLESVIDRSRALRDVLKRVLAEEGALDHAKATLESRVDDDGILYLRLDKQEAAQGRLRLREGEDAVQLRLKVEAHPAGRKASLAVLQQVFLEGV